jgi:hypothetical protein
LEPKSGTGIAILETALDTENREQGMAWEADTFIMPAAAEEKPSVEPDELALDGERRHAAPVNKGPSSNPFSA